MDCFTPQQTHELIARVGCKKAHMRIDKLFINSCLSGPLLAFGCAVLVSVNASPWYQDNAPGLIRMLGALLFPVGLVMITLSGADLWTTNVMFMTTAYLSRRVHIIDVLKSLSVSFFGNLAGMLFAVAIVFGYGGVFEESEIYRQAAINLAFQKAVLPQWHQIFLRAIGANWLVCFAVWMSTGARESVSKVTAIWWPTATFVALALDHVVANMFFIPMAIWLGAPAPLNVGFYIWKSLIPVALGNFVGGSLFVGAAYWYLYLTGTEGVSIKFDLGSVQTTIQGGAGPGNQSLSTDAVNEGEVASIASRARDGGAPGAIHSGFAVEMNDNSPYAKTWAARQVEKLEGLNESSGNSSGTSSDEKV